MQNAFAGLGWVASVSGMVENGPATGFIQLQICGGGAVCAGEGRA
jgi:hypothetical protein